VVGADQESIAVPATKILFAGNGIQGWNSGSSIVEDTLRFAEYSACVRGSRGPDRIPARECFKVTQSVSE